MDIHDTELPVEAFVDALRAQGRTDGEIEAAHQLARWAEQQGLMPLFRHQRQALVFRWPPSPRKVGGVFSMSPGDGHLSFELKWLLSEPAFRGQGAGDELVKQLEDPALEWVRSPWGRGFPCIALSSLEDAGQAQAVRDAITWIVAGLDAAEGDATLAAVGEPAGDGVDTGVPPEQVGRQIDAAIERFLATYELPHTRAADGSYDVPRSYEPWLGRGVVVNLARRGVNGTILQVLVTPDRLTPSQRWCDVLCACEEWNAVERWPKVYLREEAPDAEGRQVGHVIAEASVDLKCGVHEEFLADWINDMIGTTFDFWRWMTTKKGL